MATTQQDKSTKKSDNGQEKMTIDTKKQGDGPTGRVTMSEDVVATIAGLCARHIDGIWSVGTPRFIAFGDNPTHGVNAEVGNKEVAVDLDVVIQYGADINQTTDELRNRLAAEMKKMAGRDLVEVNINVVDIHLEEEESSQEEEQERRVR